MHVRFGSARRCRSNINYTGFNRGKAYVNFKIMVYSAGDVIDLSVLMTDLVIFLTNIAVTAWSRNYSYIKILFLNNKF